MRCLNYFNLLESLGFSRCNYKNSKDTWRWSLQKGSKPVVSICEFLQNLFTLELLIVLEWLRMRCLNYFNLLESLGFSRCNYKNSKDTWRWSLQKGSKPVVSICEFLQNLFTLELLIVLEWLRMRCLNYFNLLESLGFSRCNYKNSKDTWRWSLQKGSKPVVSICEFLQNLFTLELLIVLEWLRMRCLNYFNLLESFRIFSM